MDIMERERLRLSQDITMDILIMVDMDMVIMAREKLRQLLSLSLVIIIMDIMARGKLRQMLLLSPFITIMDILMEAMVIMDMDMDIMARERQSQDTITMDMDIMVMDMAMVMVIMVKQATIYLFKNFSKLKRISLNLVKRNTHLLKNSKFTLCNKRLNITKKKKKK